MPDYTTSELMVSRAAKELKNGDVVFVGIGVPSLAVNLADRMHASGICMIYESGAVGCVPKRLPISIGDPCLVTGSVAVVPMFDVFNLYLQNGLIDVSFLGGALYRFTSVGLRLRATAVNPYAAALSGINTNATSMLTWGMAGALAAVSGILIAPLVAVNVFFMTLLALRAFAAALVGGLTSIWGGFLAGVLLGVLEGVVAYKSPVRGITDAIVAVGIIVLVVSKPGGLVRADY